MAQGSREHRFAQNSDEQHYRSPVYHRPQQPDPVQKCPPVPGQEQPWYGSDLRDYPRSPVRDSELIYRSPESEQKKAELRRAPKPEKQPKKPQIPADGLLYSGPASRKPSQLPKVPPKPRIPADGLLYRAPAAAAEQPMPPELRHREPVMPGEPAAPVRKQTEPVRREPEKRREAPPDRKRPAAQKPQAHRGEPEKPAPRRPDPPEKTGLWKKLLGAAAVILLILAMVATIAAGHLLGKFGSFDHESRSDAQDQAADLRPEAGDETVPAFTEAPELSIADSVNIMLIGADASPDGVRSRSDTMILVTLNPKRNAIQMTSFMRDTYVHIPGYQDNRLNAAYRFGGVELMNDTIRKNFGVTVDGNVMVDFTKFAEIIDLLGGVDMELSREEANYMIREGCMLEPGPNHLTGEQALTFVRMRYVSGGDYGRTERQRRVLSQLMATFRDADLGTIMNLVEQILPSITTNVSKMDIIKYVTNGMILLSQNAAIETLQIPANDAHRADMISGMSVLVPDFEMCREDLEAFFAPRAPQPQEPAAQPTA